MVSEWAMQRAIQIVGQLRSMPYDVTGARSVVAIALDAARRAGMEEAADLAEQISHYCGTNVQPAIAQIIEQIRKLAQPDSAEGRATETKTPSAEAGRR